MQVNQPRPINEVYCINESIMLGKGSTGNVYLGFERKNPHNRVAIKVIDLRTIDNQVTRYLLSCQIAALSNLGKLANTGHENIVKLYDIVIQDHFIYLVMENLEGGTLANYIKKHPQGLNQNQALFIFRQILEGYAHMRLKQIVHRDLKPDNVLFKIDPQRNKKVAIIDFGYCQMQEVPNKPQMYYNVGSPKYMSPQAYKQNHYSQKSDIWALGVIFYEMLIGRTCDHGMSMEKYLEMIERQGIPLPPKINSFNQHILCTMLNYTHHNRLTAQQILMEIDVYLSNLYRQKSEVLLRASFEDNENRLTEDNINLKTNKNYSVFQSLILYSPNQRTRRNHQENENSWDKNQYRFQRNQAKPRSRAPTIRINLRPIPQTHRQEHIGNVDNINSGSVRQIVHRRLVIKSNEQQPTSFRGLQNSFLSNTFHQLPPHHLYQNNQPFSNIAHNFYKQSESPNSAEVPIHIDQNKQNMIPVKSQFINPSQSGNVNSLPKSAQVISNNVNYKSPPTQYTQTGLHAIGVPSNEGIKIRIQNHSLLHIQQEKRIQLQQPIVNKFYHSPEKNPITIASSVQFFTQKKNNLPSASKMPQTNQRQVINLRPAYINGQVKLEFAKIQPQRALRFNQIQNQAPMVKQEFCL